MTVRPITLRPWQVRAALDGRLRQIRTALKTQPNADCIEQDSDFPNEVVPWLAGEPQHSIVIPFAPGDRLDPAVIIEKFPDYAVSVRGFVYSSKSGEWVRLTPKPNSKGYPSVTLCGSNGLRRTSACHRLACEAFHGPRPSTSHEVRHINGDKTDSRASNLYWGTQIENWRDRKAHGRGAEGEKHHAAKLSDEDRAHVKWAIGTGLCSQRHAARILGLSQSAINSLMNRKSHVEPPENPNLEHFNMHLVVGGVRVQRLHDATEEDAETEGYQPILVPPDGGSCPHLEGLEVQWIADHGPEAWAANPWCAVAGVDMIAARKDE